MMSYTGFSCLWFRSYHSLHLLCSGRRSTLLVLLANVRASPMQTFARPSFASDRNLEFSIIIPTLNEGAHIGRLLNSLHSQLIDNFEIIIADGGSQDATAKIARSFGARVFVLEGAKEFEARNYSAAQSKASILVFFFFSSRRRHTRWTGDWSSDVCSSD